MIQYRIEKGVPAAKYAKNKLQNTIDYPLANMRVGDSFRTEDNYDKQTASRIRGRLNLIKQRIDLPDAAFSVAKDPKSNKIRVWRIQ
jgi:hypothetical protein